MLFANNAEASIVVCCSLFPAFISFVTPVNSLKIEFKISPPNRGRAFAIFPKKKTCALRWAANGVPSGVQAEGQATFFGIFNAFDSP